MWDQLDALRQEQHRLIAQVAADLEALEAVDAEFAAEDAEHADALRQAHRDGVPLETGDDRTPPGDRAARRQAIEERLWAGVHVLAEHSTHVVDAVRGHEDSWLAELRSRLVPAQEKRRREAAPRASPAGNL